MPGRITRRGTAGRQAAPRRASVVEKGEGAIAVLAATGRAPEIPEEADLDG